MQCRWGLRQQGCLRVHWPYKGVQCFVRSTTHTILTAGIRQRGCSRTVAVARDNAYTWYKAGDRKKRHWLVKKSKQQGKPAWVVQYHRKIIGACRCGDGDRPMPPKGVAGSSAQAGSTPAVGFLKSYRGEVISVVRGIENGQGRRRERG